MMLLRQSVRVLHKRLSDGITLQNVLPPCNARTIYNNESTIDFWSLSLKEQRNVFKSNEDKEIPEAPRPEGDYSFVWFTTTAPETKAAYFSLFHLNEWWEHYKTKGRKVDQRFISLRHKILGDNLAAAHFIIPRGGKVKFRGQPDWITKESDYLSKIPNVYDPQYILTALDASEVSLVYEGLHNIFGLYYLEWLSLKGSSTIDDWCLDRLSAEFPRLEYLDISECKNITERGLESLYRMLNLKKLIVTNYGNTVAVELSCLMLEDVNPFLTCEIRAPEETNVKGE